MAENEGNMGMDFDDILARLARQPPAPRTTSQLAEEFANDPAILDRFDADLKDRDFAGDTHIARLLFLSLTSRVLPDCTPVSVLVKGLSGDGKTHVVKSVRDFFPRDDAWYERSALSAKALIYGNEPIAHRFLVISEADDLSRKDLYYLRVLQDPGGSFEYEYTAGRTTRTIVRKGPIGLILTTTGSLNWENESRMLCVRIPGSREQTRGIFLNEADPRPVDNTHLAVWHALHADLVQCEPRVVIPYATRLANYVADAVPGNDDRARATLHRRFRMVLTLIKAHAALHRATRQRDGAGQILATLDDYRVVRELVAAPLREDLDNTAPRTVRQTVAALVPLTARGTREVTGKELRRALGLDKANVSRRVREAIDLGYVRNLETRPNQQQRLVLGDPLPDDIDLLPPVEALRDGS